MILLKDLRRQERWEQDDLAKRLGTSQQTVSNWENGTLPRAGALRKLNDLLVELKLPPVSIAAPTLPVIDPPLRVRRERELPPLRFRGPWAFRESRLQC